MFIEPLRARLRLLGLDSEIMETDEAGKVGRIPFCGKVHLGLTTKNPMLHVVGVDADGQVSLRPSNGEKKGKRVFLHEINLHLTEKAPGRATVTYAQYPENHFRVLHLIGDGVVQHWEMALVSQEGVYWVTAQHNFDFHCGRTSDGQFICPQFDATWPQMTKVLEQLLNNQKLPQSVVVPEPNDNPTAPLTGNAGEVKWWDPARQMGAIFTLQGEVRVHFSQIASKNGDRRELFPGQLVSFRQLREVVIKPGQRHTGFTHEAVGVTPIAATV